MKALIWIACSLGLFLINLLLFPFGVRLGYLPVYLILVFLPRYLCKKWDIRVIEKEAHSKGMSIRQYVASIVPPSLMTTCESLKGNSSELKKNLKWYIEEKVITKRISVVLFEMYK